MRKLKYYWDWNPKYWLIGYVCLYYDGYNKAIHLGPLQIYWIDSKGPERELTFPRL